MPLAEEEMVKEGTRHSMHLLWDNHRDDSCVMSAEVGVMGISNTNRVTILVGKKHPVYLTATAAAGPLLWLPTAQSG